MSDEHMTDFDRFGRITASVVAAILRVPGETKSRKWAWRVITGREPIKPAGWDQQRGLDHEEDAVAAVEVELCALAKPGRFVAHPTFHWLGASPDGFIEEIIHLGYSHPLDIPIEAKCPRQLHVEVPPVYFAQMQIQLECCDVPHGYFVSWTEEFQRVIKVYRDPAWWATNAPILLDFYKSYVVTDLEPPKSPRRAKEEK